MDTYSIRTMLDRVIERTTKLDFKMFSSLEKKKQQLMTIKGEIDDQIDQIIDNLPIDREQLFVERVSLWLKSDADARDEFGLLEEKKMLNGFYLQEVMHRYAEAQADYVLAVLARETTGGNV